jgi:uncharacterized protein (DUF433 family)
MTEMEWPEALIERLPDCLHWSPDGEIRVVGHRIGLYSVIDRHQSGHSIEEILEEFPTLSLDQIRSIIGFYQANQQEVGTYVQKYRDELRRQEEAYVPSPAVLRVRRLMEEKARTAEKA